MSGATCVEQKLGGVYCHSLRAPPIRDLLAEYQSLLQALMGPHAGTLLLQHKGGLDTFLNSSSDLLNRLQPHHPCIKFINCLMAAQNSSYGNCGLYVGVLCCSLLKELLALDDGEVVSTIVVKDAAHVIMNDMLLYLENKPSHLVTTLDLSKLEQIMSFVNTNLCSKNLGLSSAEKDHVKMKIVECFLETVPPVEAPADVFGQVHVTTIEGRSSVEAKVLHGVLFRDQEPNAKLLSKLKSNVNIYQQQTEVKKSKDVTRPTTENCQQNVNKKIANNSNQQTRQSVTYNTKISNISKYVRNSLHEDVSHGESCNERGRRFIRVILFNVPLSFEKSETERVKLAGIANEEVYNVITTKKLLSLAKRASVDIIACQKFVSPVIKFECERAGVLVLERLGTQLADYFQRLTGCVTLTDVEDSILYCGCADQQNQIGEATSNVDKLSYSNRSDTMPPNCTCSDAFVGQLTRIDVVELSDKSYLQLDNVQPFGSSEGDAPLRGDQQLARSKRVVTLLLPAMSGVMAENLKVVVEETLLCLRGAALQPLVVAGGGCLEAALAHVAAAPGTRTYEQLDASPAQITMVSSCFARVFGQLSIGLAGSNNSTDCHLHLQTGHLVHQRHLLPKQTPKHHSVAASKCAAINNQVIDEKEDTGADNDSVTGATSSNWPILSQQQQGCEGNNAKRCNTRTTSDSSKPSKICNANDGYSSCANVGCSSCANTVSLQCGCGFLSTVLPTCEDDLMMVPIRDLYDIQWNLNDGVGSLNLGKKDKVENYASNSKDGAALSEPRARGLGSLNSKESPARLDSQELSVKHQFRVSKDVLVESYFAKLNAIRLAFEGVMQLYDVDFCIFDR